MNYHSFFSLRIFMALIACAAVPLGMSGCTTARIPATDLEVPLLDIPLPAVLRGQNDLRSRSWTKSFQLLHERMKLEYAYTDHKGLDWDGLYAEFAPMVAAAQEEKDREAWYLTLRRYVYSIPDGNVQIDPNEVLRTEEEGASSGIALAELADGTVIVCGVLPDSPAEVAGVAVGAIITIWNEKPVQEALSGTSILWADAPPATAAMRRQQQLIWLPRGGEGEVCRVTFQNPGAEKPETVTLERELDDYETLALYRPVWEPVELFSSPVASETLEEGLRYIRIAAVAPTLSTPFPVRDFRTAVRSAIDGGASGIIIDLRGTQGGDPALAPKMLGSFVAEPAFYEAPGMLDMETTEFKAMQEKSVTVEPEIPAYTGPIVVLVDAYTMGPAESIARFLQGRSNAQVCGMSGTYGSPGVPNVELTLPGGHMVFYADRQSLDVDGAVAGVTNGADAGNVIPDKVVTLDAETAKALYDQHLDVVLEAAKTMLQ